MGMPDHKEKENKKAEARSHRTASAYRSLSSFSSINYSKKQTYRKENVLSENPENRQ